MKRMIEFVNSTILGVVGEDVLKAKGIDLLSKSSHIIEGFDTNEYTISLFEDMVVAYREVKRKCMCGSYHLFQYCTVLLISYRDPSPLFLTSGGENLEDNHFYMNNSEKKEDLEIWADMSHSASALYEKHQKQIKDNIIRPINHPQWDHYLIQNITEDGITKILDEDGDDILQLPQIVNDNTVVAILEKIDSVHNMGYTRGYKACQKKMRTLLGMTSTVQDETQFVCLEE